jgi:hypothetical protein
VLNNEEEEHIELVKPPADTSLSNDKEVSTEAHSFIIIPLETHHEPKASVLQCLKEPYQNSQGFMHTSVQI